MNETNPRVNFYFQKQTRWHAELASLRSILLACSLQEELKWGVPCYTSENRNIVLVHVFKHYCAVLFFKGALLKDAEGILVQQTRNTQSARQIRFTDVAEISKRKALLKAYVKEAIELEKTGAQVLMKKTADFDVPEEFRQKLASTPGLKSAFQALTPGRQRGYLLYFSGAKLAKTRVARIAKSIPSILMGKGLDD